MSATWAENTIWWSVYPLGACGAPIRTADEPGPHHRLAILENWLDHVLSMGCNGLQLGPIFASATHGYDILDHLRVDPRLGDMDDVDSLIAACHGRGIRVMLDGVFNHVASTHARVEQARREGLDSDAGQLFRRDPGRADGLSRFEGHDALVEIDHSSAQAHDYVVSIMEFWLAHGIDGWRLDAAYRIPRPFLASVIAEVKTRYADALMMGEILHGDYARIAEEAGLDSITQYELWKAIWSGIADRNPHELVWALQRHQATRHSELPWTFVGNHDVTRIASQVGANGAQVGVHGAQVAAAIVMTLPGMPALYYGDEWAWTGVKEEREGGDDAIRPALPDEGPASLDLNLQPDTAQTLRVWRLLSHIRRTKPWIATGSVEVTAQSYRKVTYQTRADSGEWLDVSLDAEQETPRLRIADSEGELLHI
jgi:glycosidase